MTDIRGTNLASGITPFTTEDTFPTHYSQYGKGGWREVDTEADRDAISTDRQSVGMVVYVAETDTSYQLKSEGWVELGLDLSTDISYTDLANKPQINSVELSGNKTLTELGIQPSGTYVTEEELIAKGYISAVPDEYVTEDELIAKGYITSTTLTSTLETYVTEEELAAKGYITSVPSEYVTETELATSLSNYVTGDDLVTLQNNLQAVYDELNTSATA